MVRGKSSFEALQQRGHDRGVRIAYYVFDVLWLDGEDLRDRPLHERKTTLRKALRFGGGTVRWTPYRRAERGEELLADACRRGWEGLIAKRLDRPYQGRRSGDWLKWKCSAEQELVIGGYTAPKGTREAFGALLVGYYDRAKLRYAGKVGTGFDQRELRDLAKRMAPLQRATSPFDAGDPPARGTTWVDAGAGRPGRLHRMDARRLAAPPALPGAPRRQAGAQGRARAPGGLTGGPPLRIAGFLDHH